MAQQHWRVVALLLLCLALVVTLTRAQEDNAISSTGGVASLRPDTAASTAPATVNDVALSSTSAGSPLVHDASSTTVTTDERFDTPVSSSVEFSSANPPLSSSTAVAQSSTGELLSSTAAFDSSTSASSSTGIESSTGLAESSTSTESSTGVDGVMSSTSDAASSTAVSESSSGLGESSTGMADSSTGTDESSTGLVDSLSSTADSATGDVFNPADSIYDPWRIQMTFGSSELSSDASEVAPQILGEVAHALAITTEYTVLVEVYGKPTNILILDLYSNARGFPRPNGMTRSQSRLAARTLLAMYTSPAAQFQQLADMKQHGLFGSTEYPYLSQMTKISGEPRPTENVYVEPADGMTHDDRQRMIAAIVCFCIVAVLLAACFTWWLFKRSSVRRGHNGGHTSHLDGEEHVLTLEEMEEQQPRALAVRRQYSGVTLDAVGVETAAQVSGRTHGGRRVVDNRHLDDVGGFPDATGGVEDGLDGLQIAALSDEAAGSIQRQHRSSTGGEALELSAFKPRGAAHLPKKTLATQHVIARDQDLRRMDLGDSDEDEDDEEEEVFNATSERGAQMLRSPSGISDDFPVALHDI